MARVKLDMPEKFVFSTEIPIRISDINYGGHLGNDAILSIAHEARLHFLANYGYSELDIEGVSVIMADTAIVYKSEGFYGDVLKIDVTPADFTRSGFDLFIKCSISGREKKWHR